MLTLNVEAHVKDAIKDLTRLEREQVPFATALAITRCVKNAESEIRDEMRRVFDRPTLFTLNSIYTKIATKRDLTGEVRIKDESVKAVPPIKWLAPNIYGGPRGVKRFEGLLQSRGLLPVGMYAVPTKAARLDNYGNVSKGLLNQILSQLGAQRDSLQNETKRSRKRKKNGFRYFVALPGRERTRHLKPGIYERKGFALGSSVRPVFLYTRQPKYRKRLDFFEITEGVVHREFTHQFAVALNQALRSATLRVGVAA